MTRHSTDGPRQDTRRTRNRQRDTGRHETTAERASPGPTAQLHRTVGNQAVQAARERDDHGRSDDRRVDPRSSDPTGAMCDRCARRYRAGKPLDCTECESALDDRSGDPTAGPSGESGPAHPVQPKLGVSQPGDAAEREAERVADEILRASEPDDTSSGVTCASCTPAESSESAVEVRRTPDESDGRTLDGDREAQVRSVTRGGRPLPASDRSFFEERFGRDFSDVRVHADGRADRLARSLDARAFTVGTDVVFRSGEYSPGTGRGRRLLAHELTHVVQQGEATVARQAAADEPRFRDCTEAVTQVRDPNEKLANAAATAVARTGEALTAIETYIHAEEPDESVRHNFGVNFSMPTYQQMLSIQETFREVQSILAAPRSFPGPLICNTEGSFACDPDGEYGASAYVFRDQAYIHVCPGAFTHERPLWNVLLHEAAHVAGRKKDCYRDDNCFRALSSQGSVANADSYAGFVLDLSN